MKIRTEAVNIHVDGKLRSAKCVKLGEDQIASYWDPGTYTEVGTDGNVIIDALP